MLFCQLFIRKKYYFVVCLLLIQSVSLFSQWAKVSAGYESSLGIKTDGTLWNWGIIIGNSNYVSDVPFQIGTSNNWQSISCGYGHALAIKTDGTLWAWGSNSDGQLGIGTNQYSEYPIQVGIDNDWNYISASNLGSSFAIKNNGTLWGWGNNLNGQLGDGSKISKSFPVQISAPNSWLKVEAGQGFTLGIKSNGTLWAWGNNSWGQLGDGTDQERLIPTIINQNNWEGISSGGDQEISYFSLGIKSNGTLWAWGDNLYGQFGNGTYENSNVPIQIGDLSNWGNIESGGFFSIAKKIDGSIWAWGDNFFGQLGSGDNINRSLPIQIGIANDWNSISCGINHVLAIRTDGSLWSWGNNFYGELGIGTTENSNIPVLVSCPTLNINITPGNLFFGNVQVGSSSNLTFSITNTGTTNLVVSSISYPSGFTGSWNGGTIAPNQSQVITATFSPTSAVSYSGSIIVNSNATSSIPCSGTGISNSASSCVVDYWFTSQSQIDNFQINNPGCTQIEGDVFIHGASINNLTGLNGITTISGQLIITGNPSLSNLNGLSNLNTVESGVFIQNNSILTNLNGLGNLTSIGGDLIIQENTSLINISGLSDNISIAGVLDIWGNTSLSSCGDIGICALIENGQSGSIFNNDIGCNYVSEIQLSCSPQSSLISLFPSSLSFGNVQVGSSSNLTFSITNTGTANLVVSSINYPSGFSGSWSGGTIAPNQSQVITATFSPTSAVSYFGSITVNSNAASGGNTITVSGNGTSAPISIISVSPTSLSFGYVQVGSSSNLTFSITNTGTANLVVSSIIYPSGFSGSWNGGTIAPNQSQVLTATFSPTSAVSYFGSISVNSNAASGGNTITVSGTGTSVTPIISLSPTSLSFGNVQVGSSTNLTFSITNTGTANLVVSSINYPSGFSGSLNGGTIAPNQSQVITATFSPTSPVSYFGSITVNSNASSGGNTITVSGTGTSATPVISVSPTSLSFGNVQVGSSSNLTFSITNTGTANLVVSSINYPGGFSGSWNGGTIAPNQSQVITDTFSPSSAVSYFGSITIISNASSGGNSITVSGTGTELPSAIISISPSIVGFGNVLVGTSSNQTFSVTNTGTGNLVVSSINYPSGFIGSWNGGIIAPNLSQVITITFSPTSIVDYFGSITINSNAASGINSITVIGTGIPLPPVINMSPSSLAFGNVPVGSSSNLTFSITNTGATGLFVSSVTYPSGFNGSWNNGMIFPNQSQVITATFSPNQAVNYFGAITVNSNASTGTNIVNCSGTGEAVINIIIPYLTVSSTNLFAGDDITIIGHDFTANGLVNIVISGPGGYFYEEELLSINDGSFSLIQTTNANHLPGYYNITSIDATGNTTAYSQYYLYPANNPGIEIITPNSSTLAYATPSQRVDVSWYDNTIPGTGIYQYNYKIEYKKQSSGNWTVANPSFSGVISSIPIFSLNYSLDLSNEQILVNPEMYQIRITDNLHLDRISISQPFDVYVPASFAGISFDWDYSYQGEGTEHPYGVTADSVSRIYVKLSGVSNVQKVVLTLQDAESNPVATSSAEIGKVMPASITNAYSDEANAAIATSATITQGLQEYTFWYVAPVDFVRTSAGSSDYDKSERLVRALFVITYNNGSTESREDYIKIVRPPLMLQHGIFSDENAFDDFRTTEGQLLTYHHVFKLVHANKLSPNASFNYNADVLLNGNGLDNSQSKSFRDVIIDMRNLGYACNRLDYVGHSMGGCVARQAINSPEYIPLSYYGKGFVNKLITLDTPHNGSPLADIGVNICESGVIDSAVAFLMARTLLLAENALVANFGPGGEVFYEVAEPYLEDAFLNIVAHILSTYLKYNPETQHFSATDAMVDLQVRNNPDNYPIHGVRLDPTSVNNHLIAGDMPCPVGDISENHQQFFKFLALFSNLIYETQFVNDPCDNITLLMESVSDNSDFANHSDFIVSTLSQCASQGPNQQQISIIPGVTHSSPFQNPALRSNVEADKVLELLNSSVSSNKFAHSIPETPLQGFHANNEEDRNMFDFESRKDTNMIVIVSPEAGVSMPVNQEQIISIRLKDTVNITSAGLFFQGKWYTVPASQATYNIQVNTNGRLGYQPVFAFAYYNDGNKLSEIWDSTNYTVTTAETPVALITSPNAILLNVGNSEPVYVKAIFPSFIAPLRLDDPALGIQVADSQIAVWDSEARKFMAVSTGTTYSIVSWSGLIDTVWINVAGQIATSNVEVKQPLNKLSVSVFPNPSDDYINLKVITTDNGKYQIDLFDVYGRKQLVQTRNFMPGENMLRLEIGQLAAGFYIVSIKNEKNQSSAVILKQ
jgi:alpha-tubulin suppressor-like RCC1 family protein/pimeloyl-ACP methyl ester carboxylesterase